MRTHILRLGCIFVGLSALLSACAEEATETAKACAESDLIAQCPPGSQPDLSAMAMGECGGEANADFIMQAGAVTGSCAGSGNCRVLCRFDNPCLCGVESISSEALVCSPCTDGGCGNGVCERGEDTDSCPRDCAGDCIPGEERCNGDSRQVCTQMGFWGDLLPCEGCVFTDGVTECQEPCDESTWYPDMDGDGYGDITGAIDACERPDGYVASGDDCDDGDAEIRPDADEICGDGQDNNCDDRADCDDSLCADGMRCQTECTQFCALYRERCDPSGFVEDDCLEDCAALDVESGNLPSYASASLECHILHLSHIDIAPMSMCARAQIAEDNLYCRPRGEIDCLTYCAVLDHSCPGTYNGNYSSCTSGCSAFTGRGSVEDEDLAYHSVQCRLSVLVSMGGIDGPECLDARPGNDQCASYEEFQVVGREISQGNETPESLSAGQHSVIAFTTSADNHSIQVTIARAMGDLTERLVRAELTNGNDYRMTYSFPEPGEYRASIEYALDGTTNWQPGDRMTITINPQP